MFNYVDMGNRMFAARTRKNIKQWEMGKMLNITQPSYSDIERGKTEINIAQLFTIAKALNVPVVWLLGIDSDPGLTESESMMVEEFKQYLKNNRKS